MGKLANTQNQHIIKININFMRFLYDQRVKIKNYYKLHYRNIKTLK